jgi:predicted nucleotidyltransferase
MADISKATLAKYKKTMHLREASMQKTLSERKAQAWEVARRAAALLYEQFSASRVVVFGSLVHELWFSPTSDIDLAAWNVSDEDYFVAVAKLQDLATDFKIDLIAMERCKPYLPEVIEREECAFDRHLPRHRRTDPHRRERIHAGCRTRLTHLERERNDRPGFLSGCRCAQSSRMLVSLVFRHQFQ